MTTLTTTMKIESWDEQPTQGFDDGSKVSRADVVLQGAAELGAGRSLSSLYYRPDGTSTFAVVMRVEATLDEHAGTIVLVGTGTYDGTTAVQELEIVEGTAGLAGITGTARSGSTHEDYPNMPLELDYELT